MKITFLGACGTVTGSMHLVEAGGVRVLVDAGMYQGPPDLERENWRRFPFEPRNIDYILLTHGHLDHIGILPRLVKEGFAGRILAHRATMDVAALMLEDAARVQEEDLATENRRRARRGLAPLAPLYEIQDVLDTVKLFGRGIHYGEEVELGGGLSLVLRDAGHILGSGFAEFRFRGKTAVFSGDLGNLDKPIVRDPSFPPEADIVVSESTYGDRLHEPLEESVENLRKIINETLSRGGNVVIPSFALERSQDILYYLREFHDQGALVPCRVFLDSPLAISVTRVFRAHPECYDEEARQLFYDNKDPFSFPGLRFTRTPEESKAINHIKQGAVIIASSGMCTGGRIKHHLKHNLWRPENSVIFVGYQAQGTLGRQISEGAPEVEIYWERIAVRARIHMLAGLSAHADQKLLSRWITTARPQRVFLVHGEPEAQKALSSLLAREGIEVSLPEVGESVEI